MERCHSVPELDVVLMPSHVLSPGDRALVSDIVRYKEDVVLACPTAALTSHELPLI